MPDSLAPRSCGVFRRKGRSRMLRSAAVLTLVAFASPAFPFPFVQIARAQIALSTFDEICVIKDREASAGVALALVNATAEAEPQLDDALSRLRRARMNCRRGWVDVARVDYDALRRVFPAADYQIRALSSPELAALPASPEQ
jgi:hypothetical protein